MMLSEVTMIQDIKLILKELCEECRLWQYGWVTSGLFIPHLMSFLMRAFENFESRSSSCKVLLLINITVPGVCVDYC